MIIGGKDYTIFFGWLEVEAVSKFAEHKSLDTTANNLGSLAKSMEFIREVAFQGVKGGFKKQGLDCPFADSESLVEAADKLTEISQVLNVYTQSVADFYASDEPAPDNKKKVTH